MKSVALKVGGPHDVIFGRFPLFHGASKMCANCFPNPSGQVVNNHYLILRGKFYTPPKLGIVCDKILTPKFGSYIWATHGTTSQNKQCQSKNNIPTCLEYEVFICYFDSHGSGHHPTLVDTFHLHVDCHLVGRKPHQIIRWRPISGCMTLKG